MEVKISIEVKQLKFQLNIKANVDLKNLSNFKVLVIQKKLNFFNFQYQNIFY